MRIANRLDNVGMNIVDQTNNAELMNKVKGLTPKLVQQQTMMNPQIASHNMNQLQDTLNNITIAGRILDTNLDENLYDENTTAGVDKMMNTLKQEIAVEINPPLVENLDLMYNKIKSKQLNQPIVISKK